MLIIILQLGAFQKAMRDSRCSFKIICFSNNFLYVLRQYLRVYCTSSNMKSLRGNSFKEQLLKKPKPTSFEMFCFCVMKVFCISVPTSKANKT